MDQGRAPSETGRTSFFTICASNYLPHAIVLGRSIAATHPAARLTVFLLDPLPPDAAGLDHLDIVAAETLMPVAEWHHYRCFYDVLELATSIKPACFLHLLADGSDHAIYFDADILLLRPLDAVRAAFAAGQDIVLTPHLLTPLPADGKLPDDLAIMRSGIYNLGFGAFANTPRSLDLLRWWQRHLRTRGMSDVRAGLFTDQKWIDFVPGFVPTTHIIRDPGYNAAYWNLHERTVRHADGNWRVDFNGTSFDLTFYHFSGYDPSATVLSKHENRFEARPPGDVPRLLSHYAAQLAAADTQRLSARAVAPPRFANGIAWDPVCRMLYRELLAEDADVGDPLRGEAFLDLAAAADLGDPLPRYLRTLLKLRPDLASVCPDGRSPQGLMGWLRGSSGRQLQVDPALLDRLGVGTDGAADAALTGVNYIGYFRSHLGVAEAARNAVAALQAAGLSVATHDISQLAESPTGDYALSHAPAAPACPHRLTILGANADQTPRVLGHLPAPLAAGVVIGYWAWETPEFPEEWCDRFDLVDEVWVASQFVADAVRRKATVPVTVVPYSVAPPDVTADRPWLIARRPEIQADEFIFLFAFDVASVPFRKNPEGTIAAFCSAFGADAPVRLIVKSINGDRDPALMASLAALGEGHRVTIWDEPLDTMDRFRLLATADAFVSLHRAEGFGLSIAEAMAYQKAVVTTAWSGSADFTNESNAALVGYELSSTVQRHGAYPAGTLWAEPKLDEAARQMRRVVDDAPWRAGIAAAGARTIETTLSPRAVGAIMQARLARIARSARATRRLDAAAARATPHVPTGTALGFVLGDARRRPLFYLMRIPRVPVLLAREGFSATLTRLALSARTRARPSPGFSLQVLVEKVRTLLSRIGLARGETRMR